MCLGKLKKIKLHRKVGYKAFLFKHANTGPVRGLYLTAVKGAKVKPGIWIEDKKEKILYIRRDTQSYKTGFHIYRTLKDAKNTWMDYDVICKVEFDNVTAVGVESGDEGESDVIVARKMKILNEVNLND